MEMRNNTMAAAAQRNGILIALMLVFSLGTAACSDDAGAVDGWDLGPDKLGEVDTGFDASPDTTEDIIPSGTGCIEVTPVEEVDFGMSSTDAVSNKTVVITNCSPNRPLNLGEIAITDDGGGVFSLSEQDSEGGLLDGNFVLEAGAQAHFVVTFAATRAVAYNGTVRIRSNDVERPSIDLALLGTGTERACPTAVALASIAGNSSHRPGTEIVANPLDTIEFDGTRSYGADDETGGITRYEWTILSSPTSSSERIMPADGSTPTLYLDASGEYRIELKVFDGENTISCGDPAIVTIRATSGEDIHVQLTWTTTEHSEDSEGRDVDLHYLHPNSTEWADGSYGWDCYYANKTPDWRVPGGSPMLDIDDLVGPGPENISHSNLEQVTYRVGVHYYSDHENGASYVTVEIRSGGVLIYSERDRRMTHEQFWEVATIDGKDLSVQPVGTTTQGLP